MAFEYLDHTAEVCIVASAPTKEGVFEEGARALFHLMVELEAVRPSQAVEVRCTSDRIDVLFADWLNALLLRGEVEGYVFSQFKVSLHAGQGRLTLEGRAQGEPFDPARHRPKLHVKAVTYGDLCFEKRDDLYQARCVVDV